MKVVSNKDDSANDDNVLVLVVPSTRRLVTANTFILPLPIT